MKTTKLITLVTVPPDVYVEAPTKAQVSSAAAMQLELLQKLNHSMHQSLQKSNDEELLEPFVPLALGAAAAAAAPAAAAALVLFPGANLAKYLGGKALNEVIEWLARQVPLTVAWFDVLENSQSACSDVLRSNPFDIWREFVQLRSDLNDIDADLSHPADNNFWEKLKLRRSFWLQRLGFLSGYGTQTSTLKITGTGAGGDSDASKIIEFKNMKAALPMAWVVEKKEVGGNAGAAIPAVPETTDAAPASYFIASDMVDINKLEAEFSCNAEPGNIKVSAAACCTAADTAACRTRALNAR